MWRLYKCNMTDIMASLGLAQFRRYPQLLQRRKEIIEKYNEGLKDLDIEVLEHYGEHHTSSGHLYLTRLNGRNRQECNEVIAKMAEVRNCHKRALQTVTYDDSL